MTENAARKCIYGFYLSTAIKFKCKLNAFFFIWCSGFVFFFCLVHHNFFREYTNVHQLLNKLFSFYFTHGS